MSISDYVSHDTRDRAIEINWRGLQLTTEERKQIVDRLQTLVVWRHNVRHFHTEGLSHYYPQIPPGVVGGVAISNYYGKVQKSIRIVIDDVILHSRGVSVTWHRGVYAVTLPFVIRENEVATKQLAATFRQRRGKVSRVAIANGTLLVATTSKTQDTELAKGLSKTTLHKAEMCAKALILV